jgi:hypothetical protein
MPKMKAKIRIIQNDSKGKQKISFPSELGWNVGDVVRYQKSDENTVVLKRLQ